jgi:hypothetical protein
MSTTGAASDYLEGVIMSWLGRNTSMPAPPSILYLALFISGVPNDDGSGAVECSAGNYARLALSTGASGTGSGSTFVLTSPTNGTMINSAEVTFPACSGANWGLVTGWALFDALSGGNMLVRGDMTPAASILIGDIFSFAAVSWSIVMS